MDAITKDDYTNRYVEAATRSLAPDQRDDYADELRASIRDQIDDRVANGEDPAEAERAVLTELGDPARLAAGYAGRQLQLIGPAFYSDWKRLLVLLLWITVPIGAFAGMIGPVVSGNVGGAVGGAIATALSVGVHVCFWVTLAFALVERFGGPARGLGEWTPDRLPLTSEGRTRFSEVVLAFVAVAVFAIVIAWDQLIGFVILRETGGDPLPFLHPGLWPWGFGLALTATLVTAVLTLLAYRRGEWATWMGIAAALLALAVTAAAVVLAVTGGLLNPEWFALVFRAADPGTVQVIQVALGVGIALLGLYAAWDAYRRTRSLR
ncbi:permease prefix domain 1-containing protein [Microbacterium sediminis]|uniref:Uncharacterized protein n=1 Tax=Microbacterium sediminis TaxID=904291 RepID=A0A1B9ND93_9MICO|nr:permease prefix domain 1-containing protein [Microbacterium sediminis]OCG74567.1 hypothetical protein A7J15_03240 [Microbacterium sediminis]QBR74866.1 hypothetical protein E3O41_10960 [Microbacterium sediminis]